MSSGFVSGGTADAPAQRSDEWLAAQQEIEANHRRKVEESRQASGRSLFETLEANKAAKQEAFEEANRLKNQFRALDADEVEFLDSVLESTRAEEQKIKKETAEGLEVFRKLQDEVDKKALAANAGVSDGLDEGRGTVDEWVASSKGKRKRGREKEGLKGVKIRRSSTTGSAGESVGGAVYAGAENSSATGKAPSRITEKANLAPLSKQEGKPPTAAPEPKAKIPAKSTAKSGLGLVDYASDSDDE